MKNNKKVKLLLSFLEEHKAEDIEPIDVSNSTPFAETYVLATAPNLRALGAYADLVEDELEKNGFDVRAKEGTGDSQWVIIDSFDVVIHLFSREKREEIGLTQIIEKAGK